MECFYFEIFKFILNILNEIDKTRGNVFKNVNRKDLEVNYNASPNFHAQQTKIRSIKRR